MQTIGTFHGTTVNYADALVEARKFMGQKGTDMNRLTTTVAHLYLNCPEDMQPHYQALLQEITRRREMIDLMPLLDVDVDSKRNVA
jgi:hypothetical protein